MAGQQKGKLLGGALCKPGTPCPESHHTGICELVVAEADIFLHQTFPALTHPFLMGFPNPSFNKAASSPFFPFDHFGSGYFISFFSAFSSPLVPSSKSLLFQTPFFLLIVFILLLVDHLITERLKISLGRLAGSVSKACDSLELKPHMGVEMT